MDQEAIDNKEIPMPELDEASAFLREQLAACHAAIAKCFEHARDEEWRVDNQWKAMQMATRLMQASAAAACALKRLSGTQSSHTVNVKHQGGDPTPKKTKTNSGRRA